MCINQESQVEFAPLENLGCFWRIKEDPHNRQWWFSWAQLQPCIVGRQLPGCVISTFDSCLWKSSVSTLLATHSWLGSLLPNIASPCGPCWLNFSRNRGRLRDRDTGGSGQVGAFYLLLYLSLLTRSYLWIFYTVTTHLNLNGATIQTSQFTSSKIGQWGY